MTRDELLVLNAIAHAINCVDGIESSTCRKFLAPYLAAFEHDTEARETFMENVLEMTDSGEQFTYTVIGEIH